MQFKITDFYSNICIPNAMTMLDFQKPSSVSHDASEIIVICLFGDQKYYYYYQLLTCFCKPGKQFFSELFNESSKEQHLFKT